MFKEKDFTTYDWSALLAAKRATERALEGLLKRNAGFDPDMADQRHLSTQEKNFKKTVVGVATRLSDIDHEIAWRNENGKRNPSERVISDLEK